MFETKLTGVSSRRAPTRVKSIAFDGPRLCSVGCGGNVGIQGVGWILPHGERILQQDLESRILIRALVTKDHMGRIVGSQPNRLLPSEDHGVRFPTDMTCCKQGHWLLRQRKWAHHATISSTSYHIWPALLFGHHLFRWGDTRISGTMALARGILTMMTTTRGHWHRGSRCPRTRPSR